MVDVKLTGSGIRFLYEKNLEIVSKPIYGLSTLKEEVLFIRKKGSK